MRRKGFSEDLVWLLSEMLEETEDRRINLESIEQVLDNVQDEEDLDLKVVSPESKEKKDALEYLNELETRKTLQNEYEYGDGGEIEAVPIQEFQIRGRFVDGECKVIDKEMIKKQVKPIDRYEDKRDPLQEINITRKVAIQKPDIPKIVIHKVPDHAPTKTETENLHIQKVNIAPMQSINNTNTPL